MMISKKIRLEVSEEDVATLEFMQGKCRGLYNWWVMRLRDGEKWPGWEEAKKTLQASKERDPDCDGSHDPNSQGMACLSALESTSTCHAHCPCSAPS